MPPFNRILTLLCLGILSLSAYAVDWLPIDPADLAATQSPDFPDADAEILYRLQDVDDSFRNEGCTTENYYRIKIYKETAVERLSKIDIEASSDAPADSIMARLIKPDGRIINLNKKDIYTRVGVNYKNEETTISSFGFPGMEVGDIIEYQWRTFGEFYYLSRKVYPRKDMPIRKASFIVTPYSKSGHSPRSSYFRCGDDRFEVDKYGRNVLTLNKIPAISNEPFMPVSDDANPWILFYLHPSYVTPDEFWEKEGKKEASDMDSYARRPSENIRNTAKDIIGDITDPAEQARLINDYCRQNILNIARYTPIDTPIIKSKSKPDPDYTLEHKQGNSKEIQALFHALARSVGLNTQAALCADATDGVFKKNILIASFLGIRIAALKYQDQWLFFDPASSIVPTGSLQWYCEGVPILISTKKAATWETSPVTPSEKNKKVRTAKLELDEEGTLQGSVRIEYFGHEATSIRRSLISETQEKREEIIRERIQKRIPLAEITDMDVSGIQDMGQNPYIAFTLKILNYGERLGSRLFLQPNIFAKGQSATFPSETRENDIFFRFGYSREDSVSIKLPKNFSLEAGQAPGSAPDAEWRTYKTKVTLGRKSNTLTYTRNFDIKPRYILKQNYSALKAFFDFVHARDQHTFSLKEKEESPKGETTKTAGL